jgi:hypothetical protein
VTRGRHGLHAVLENGPAARSFAADGHHCIMIQVRIETYRIQVCSVNSAPYGGLPLDRSTPGFILSQAVRLTRDGRSAPACDRLLTPRSPQQEQA